MAQYFNKKEIKVDFDAPIRIRTVDRNANIADVSRLIRVVDTSATTGTPIYRVRKVKDGLESNNIIQKNIQVTITPNSFNQFRLKSVAHDGVESPWHTLLLYAQQDEPNGPIITDPDSNTTILNAAEIIELYLNDYLSEVYLNTEFKDILTLPGFEDTFKSNFITAFSELINLNHSENVNYFKELEKQFEEIVSISIEEAIDVITDNLISQDEICNLDAIEDFMLWITYNLNPDSLINNFEDIIEALVNRYVNEIIHVSLTEQLQVDFSSLNENQIAIIDIFKSTYKAFVSELYADFKIKDTALLGAKDIISLFLNIEMNEYFDLNISENLKKDYSSIPKKLQSNKRVEVIDELLNQYKTFLQTIQEIKKLEIDEIYKFIFEQLIEDNMRTSFADLIEGLEIKSRLYEHGYIKISSNINALTYSEDKKNIYLSTGFMQKFLSELLVDVSYNLDDILKNIRFIDIVSILKFTTVEDKLFLKEFLTDIMSIHEIFKKQFNETYPLINLITDFWNYYQAMKVSLEEKKVFNKNENYKANTLKKVKDLFLMSYKDSLNQIDILKKDKDVFFNNFFETVSYQEGLFGIVGYDIMGQSIMGMIPMGYGPS